jgi:hypothetical protein
MGLSEQDLLSRIGALAGRERETTVELVAHLAVLELRPNLYRAQGYGSLFRYCTDALRLSEDAACNRTKVTRACREFPIVLSLMATGTVSLTTVKMLAPHLTVANHEEVLARAANRSREDIQALVAELAPKPDVAASVRKLPTGKEEERPVPMTLALPSVASVGPAGPGPAELRINGEGPDGGPAVGGEAPSQCGPVLTVGRDDTRTPFPRSQRPVVRASAPGRYRVQFTIDRETYDDLRAVQALLRREIPSGDPGVIFGRAIHSLRRQVEKAKCGVATSRRRRAEAPRPGGGQDSTYEMRIRPRTDDGAGSLSDNETGNGGEAGAGELEPDGTPVAGSEAMANTGEGAEHGPSSRHIPNAVKRAVWRRDRHQCAFVSADGRRCTERAFLELHHIRPYALDGPATVNNIALRCRSHNQYESEVIFGPYGEPHVREGGEAPYAGIEH